MCARIHPSISMHINQASKALCSETHTNIHVYKHTGKLQRHFVFRHTHTHTHTNMHLYTHAHTGKLQRHFAPGHTHTYVHTYMHTQASFTRREKALASLASFKGTMFTMYLMFKFWDKEGAGKFATELEGLFEKLLDDIVWYMRTPSRSAEAGHSVYDGFASLAMKMHEFIPKVFVHVHVCAHTHICNMVVLIMGSFSL